MSKRNDSTMMSERAGLIHNLLKTGVCLLLAGGCGPHADLANLPQPLQPLTGRVLLDGKPLPGVVLSFLPKAEGGALSIGETDAEGRYRLSYVGMPGCAPGDYDVVFSYKTMNDGQPLSLELQSGLILPKEALSASERMPKKYAPGSAGLKATVPMGGGMIDFMLEGPLQKLDTK